MTQDHMATYKQRYTTTTTTSSFPSGLVTDSLVLVVVTYLVALFIFLIGNSRVQGALASTTDPLGFMVDNNNMFINSLPIHSSHRGRRRKKSHDDDGLESWGMVERRGSQFMIKDQPFYVNGFNTYWLMVHAADESTRGKVTDVLSQASSVGLTVCRTWAFSDGGSRALQVSPSVYNEQVFKGLDFVVSEAKKYKIRLILALCDNWEGYGGKAQYVKWGREAGLSGLTSINNDDFFSHPTLKAYYKAHVKTVLNRVNTLTNVRYKDDPTIFAWELMNEPRCMSDPSGDKLQGWIEEMALHVKSIDPNHLLEIGLEGFYGPSSPERLQFNPGAYTEQFGTDFIRNHQALGVDFASAHIYPDCWIQQATTDSRLDFVKTWMQKHMDDAENQLGMPVIFGEFGVNLKDNRFTETFRDMIIFTVYQTLLDSTRRGGSGGGCLLWQLFPEGTENMDDGYAVVLTKSPTTSYLVSLQSTRLQTFNSKCSWRCHWGCDKRNPRENMFITGHEAL